MQKRRIGVARQPRDHRIAFVAARSDRVKHLLLHTQHARHQVEVPRDQLRLEQLEEIARAAQAVAEHGFIERGLVLHVPVPLLHELDEVLVADFGTVDVLVAGRDGGCNGVHSIFSCLSGFSDKSVSGIVQSARCSLLHTLVSARNPAAVSHARASRESQDRLPGRTRPLPHNACSRTARCPRCHSPCC